MVTKRFIAGAVCPRCAEMDRLVTYETSEGSFKECVQCGYQEKQVAQVEIKELDTRVNSADSESEQAEPVKLMLDSNKKKS